jgi:hypothetical protein
MLWYSRVHLGMIWEESIQIHSQMDIYAQDQRFRNGKRTNTFYLGRKH